MYATRSRDPYVIRPTHWVNVVAQSSRRRLPEILRLAGAGSVNRPGELAVAIGMHGQQAGQDQIQAAEIQAAEIEVQRLAPLREDGIDGRRAAGVRRLEVLSKERGVIRVGGVIKENAPLGGKDAFHV